MAQIDGIGARVVITIAILIGLLYIPAPVLSQQDGNIQNLIVNGGFEDGIQEGFGVGYGWGGFSNGQAVVGWNSDTWDKVVVEGQAAQLIQIENASERDRYGGLYQTIAVVPGQQYKLTIKGLIRSEEGSIAASDYGYRLQFAVDYSGGTTWELLPGDAWQELSWDEQPLYIPESDSYRIDTYDTTITATGDTLTLFVRGWKKWVDNGTGIYNLDEISLVGPAPAGFTAPVAQQAAVSEPGQSAVPELETDSALQSEHDEVPVVEETQSESTGEAATPTEETTTEAEESTTTSESSTEGATSTDSGDSSGDDQAETQLPVSGQGQDDTINYVVITGAILLLILLGGAFAATRRQRPL
ncbi:MAG: hypothetical protein AAF485_23285 [Chloroflexota bacterium]